MFLGHPVFYLKLLLVDSKSLEELGQGDAVSFGSLSDCLAPGNSTADAAHTELEERFGRIGLCLEQVIDCTVSVDFSHRSLSLPAVT
jgi:hypothetical protein